MPSLVIVVINLPLLTHFLFTIKIIIVLIRPPSIVKLLASLAGLSRHGWVFLEAVLGGWLLLTLIDLNREGVRIAELVSIRIVQHDTVFVPSNHSPLRRA